MQRILIKCETRLAANDFKTYLESELPYEIAMAYSHIEMETILRELPTHLLILQTGSAISKDLQYVQSIRSNGYSHPILVVTQTLGNLAFDTFSEKYKAYFLERPFEPRTLRGLARKLLVMKSVSQQVHRRYRTHQSATLESVLSSEKVETRMYNLSVGGAYFEMPKRPDVRVGDLLKVKIPLDHMKREHLVHGRVIWTTHRGHSSGEFGVGVRFMKTNDIFRQIVDKV